MNKLIKILTKEQWKEIGYIALKTLIFVILFSILHFLYSLNENPFFRAIAGKDESVFQHLKMGFFSYLLLIIFDYLLVRKKIENRESFLYSRLLSSLLVPWMIFIIWYLAPAIIGLPLSLPWELTWAFFVVIVVGILASLFDKNIEKISFNKSVKIIIIGLIIISIFLFILFSFNNPWIDVFVEP